MPVAGQPGAAFFDLDRTLISRSSSLALAGTFRRRGLIGRRQLAQATVAQLVFARFGAGQSRVGQTADSAMALLRGLPVALMREIAAEAWAPVFKPLVYREALDHAEQHAARGQPVYIASAALEEVVEEISRRLGFAGPSPRVRRCATARIRVCSSAGCTVRRKPTRWVSSPRRRVSNSTARRRTPTRTPTSRSSPPSVIR